MSSVYSRLQRRSPEQNGDVESRLIVKSRNVHHCCRCLQTVRWPSACPFITVLFLGLKRTSRCTASFCNTTHIAERSHSRAQSAVVRRVHREAWCSQLRICANVALHRKQGDNDEGHVGKPHRKAISAQSPQMPTTTALNPIGLPCSALRCSSSERHGVWSWRASGIVPWDKAASDQWRQAYNGYNESQPPHPQSQSCDLRIASAKCRRLVAKK